MEGEPENEMQIQVNKIFQESQESFDGHRRSMTLLRKLFAEDPSTRFQDALMSCINRILIVFKRSPNVERLIQLVIRFLKYDDKMSKEYLEKHETLLFCILEYLVDFADSKDKAVRFRICQLIALILDGYGPEASVDEDLWVKLSEAMCRRAKDKIVGVRIQAAHALERLQNPYDDSDAVTYELLRMMITDRSKDARKAALRSIALSKRSFSDVLIRLRDVSPEVRSEFFVFVRDKANLKNLSITDRVKILDQGLGDRDKSVLRACEALVLKKWLVDCHNDPVKLLDVLDVEHNEATGLRVASVILAHEVKCGRIDFQETVKSADIITPALALYLRAQCTVDKRNGNDLNLPDTMKMVSLLSKLMEKNNPGNDFIIKQLLQVTRFLDFHDEIGTRTLIGFLGKTLVGSHVDLTHVEPILRLLAAAHRNELEYVRIVGEILSDLNDSIDEYCQGEQDAAAEAENKDLIGRLQAIEDLMDEKEEREETEDEEYAELQREADELATQLEKPGVLLQLRALKIASVVLRTTKQVLSNPTIAGLDRMIFRSVQDDVPAVRELAVECLGLYCALDKQTAESHFALLWHICTSEDEDEEVQLAGLKSAVDLVSVFNILEDSQKPKPTLQEFQGKLLNFMIHEHCGLRSVSLEGTAKLFALDRLSCPTLLASLIETFFFQNEKSDGRSIQVLTKFLPTYATSSVMHQELLYRVSWPLLLRILYARPDTPYEQMDFNICGTFLLQLLQNPPSSNMTPWHNLIGVEILIESIANGTTKHVTMLCRLVNVLDLVDDLDTMRKLIYLLRRAKSILTQAAALKTVEKVLGHCETLLGDMDDEVVIDDLEQKIDLRRDSVKKVISSQKASRRRFAAARSSSSSSLDEETTTDAEPLRLMSSRKSKDTATERLNDQVVIQNMERDFSSDSD